MVMKELDLAYDYYMYLPVDHSKSYIYGIDCIKSGPF